MLGPKDWADLVTLDEDGVIWFFCSGSRRELAQYCIRHYALWHPDLGSLVRALQAGACVGLLSDLAPQFAAPWQGSVDV